jgi:hypothetical protein
MRMIVVAILLACPAAARSEDEPRVRAEKATSPEVDGLRDGKPVHYSPAARDRLVAAALRLLGSCSYSQGGYGEEDWKKAQEGDHVRVHFPQPPTVTADRRTLKVPDLVVTLPLASGGIWIRSGGQVLYFAKYNHDLSERLRKCIEEGKPAP